MKLRLANKVYKRAMLEFRPTRLSTFDRAMKRLPRATVREYWWLSMCLAVKYAKRSNP
jgi:hypothetical protein